MRLITDPRLFNYLIMCLYLLSATRWAISREWAQMFYWLGALWITASVTFGMTH